MFKQCREPGCTQPITAIGADRSTKSRKFYKKNKKKKGISTTAHSLRWSKYCYYHHKQHRLEAEAEQTARQQREKRTRHDTEYGGLIL